MTVPIYLALLLSVVGFAAGWVTSTLRQKSTMSELVRARENAQVTVEQYRSALNIIVETRASTGLEGKPLNAVTVSQNPNWSMRYEPS